MSQVLIDLNAYIDKDDTMNKKYRYQKAFNVWNKLRIENYGSGTRLEGEFTLYETKDFIAYTYSSSINNGDWEIRFKEKLTDELRYSYCLVVEVTKRDFCVWFDEFMQYLIWHWSTD